MFKSAYMLCVAHRICLKAEVWLKQNVPKYARVLNMP